MERLQMDRIRDVIYRLRAGESERRISRDMDIARGTVHKYHQWAESQGYLDPSVSLPDILTLREDLGEAPQPPKQRSSLEPFTELIKELLDHGCQMTVIYARLCANHGYTGS